APRKTRGLIQAVSLANTIHKGTNVATGASSATTVITPVAAHSLSVGDVVFFTRTGAATNITTGRPYWVQAVSTTVSFSVAATDGGSAITLGTSSANIDYRSAGSTAPDVDDINEFAQLVYDGGGLTDGLGTFLVNSSQKVALSKAYADAYGKANPLITGQNVGGVRVDQIETDFGRLNIMVDRAMPQDSILLTSLSELRTKFLLIPGKGSFFEEPLAKVGASEDSQLYGEIGLQYGSPIKHGLLTGLPFRGQ
ncbi:SU10 major capsid protein, partial [Actinophytocola sediminis]